MATGSLDTGGFFSGITLRGLLDTGLQWDIARRQAEGAKVTIEPATQNSPTSNAGMTGSDYAGAMNFDSDTLIKTALGVAAVIAVAGVAIYIGRKVL